ncbi:2464_t:CDS:2 [Acaulospora morrowiae]|uniref:2464_t:CDS:1 n=1 Tax=Acaulospora morrowiae TaxID=94023 RepID=A0A9N9DFI4_9GLOM|nr:2464_t:CDS:2 [Acaulospora morrowiae]
MRNPLFPGSDSSPPRVLSLTTSTTESKYSEDPKDCVFCKIISGELPCIKIFENEHVLAFLDAAPISRGHSLVIPKTHVTKLTLASSSLVAEIGAVLPKVTNAVIKGVNATDFNVLQNNGQLAGQVVFHLHFHIIPRFKNEDQSADRKVKGRLRLSKEETEGIGSNIRAKL